MNLLRKKEFDSAVEIFTELEIVHPYSSYSSKARLWQDLPSTCQINMKRQYLL